LNPFLLGALEQRVMESWLRVVNLPSLASCGPHEDHAVVPDAAHLWIVAVDEDIR